MALTPDEFYAHALAAADSERRMPLTRMTDWQISPFERDGLQVSPLRPPVLPEPDRQGADPADCNSCRNRDDGIWLDKHWRLTRVGGVGMPLVLMLHPREHHDLADLPDELAAQFGVLSAHIARPVEALPNIARAHVYRISDGGAHCTCGSSPGRSASRRRSVHGWWCGTTCCPNTRPPRRGRWGHRGRCPGGLLRRRSTTP